MSALEHDRRQAATVVAHASERVATVTEKRRIDRERVGAGGDDAHAFPGRTAAEIARQIEQETASGWGGAETRGVRSGLGEGGSGKIRPELVRGWSETGAVDG